MSASDSGIAPKAFLSWVRAAHGPKVSGACERVIADSESDAGLNAPLGILARALDEVYGEDLALAEAAAIEGFDSD